MRIDHLLFAEGGARVLISCSDQNFNQIKKLASEYYKEFNILLEFNQIGEVTTDDNFLIINHSSSSFIHS